MPSSVPRSALLSLLCLSGFAAEPAQPSSTTKRLLPSTPELDAATDLRREERTRVLTDMAVVVWRHFIDGNERFAESMAVIRATYMERDFTAAMKRMLDDPALARTWVYVRPAVAARADQILFVEDPAVWSGKGCVVVPVRGQPTWVAGQDAALVWKEAQRLAALPAAKAEGIRAADWEPILARLSKPPQARRDAAGPAPQNPPSPTASSSPPAPSLAPSRSDLSGVAGLLKRSIFSAEIQFQAGAYADGDADGRGAYGFLDEMAGSTVVAGGSRVGKPLSLLPREFNQGPVAGLGAWSFTVFLPGATAGSWVRSVAACKILGNQGEDGRENDWLAFAWPTDGKAGTVMKISANGTVLQAPWPGGSVATASDQELSVLDWKPYIWR